MASILECLPHAEAPPPFFHPAVPGTRRDIRETDRLVLPLATPVFRMILQCGCGVLPFHANLLLRHRSRSAVSCGLRPSSPSEAVCDRAIPSSCHHSARSDSLAAPRDLVPRVCCFTCHFAPPEFCVFSFCANGRKSWSDRRHAAVSERDRRNFTAAKAGRPPWRRGDAGSRAAPRAIQPSAAFYRQQAESSSNA
jgi:hypothetical protein